MQKLLSLVLSISILCSSVTPAWSQARGVSRGVVRGMGSVAATGTKRVSSPNLSAAVNRRVYTQMAFANSTVQSRMDAGQTAGLANYMLSLPVAKRTATLRQDFVALSFIPQAVSPAERTQAGALLEKNLTDAKKVFSQISQTDLADFLAQYRAHPKNQLFKQVQDVLADASALAFVATREQSPALLNFYEQARGTLFEETAALITARGLLRMQAYEELSGFLIHTDKKTVLAGLAAYTKMKGLPVEIPASLQQISIPTANEELAVFLGKTFWPNRLYADPSVEATRDWLGLQQPEVTAPQANSQAVANKVSLPVEPIKIEEPVTLNPIQPLVLSPMVSSEITAEPARVNTSAAVTSTAQPVYSSSREGIMYSGIPVFAIIDASKRALAWMRQKFSKKPDTQALYEEPGLHDSNVRPVLASVDVPEGASIGGDLVGADNEIQEVSVGVGGFKLTVEGESKVEHILHNVDLTVSADLKNFAPEYNRLALDTNYIFELRNQTIPAKRPDHFFFALSVQNGEFDALIRGTKALALSRPMRIKIQKTGSPKKTVTVPVYDEEFNETSLVAEVDTGLLAGVKNPEQGSIWYDGKTLMFQEKHGTVTPLENAFVRLPKAESKHWTQIFKMYPDQPFHLMVLSTTGKMVPVTYLVPSLQIGLGKTLSPELHDTFGVDKDTSSNIMMGINNVLPALMIFVHPLMKQYGEAAVYRVGAAMFSLCGLIALSTGLYGHVGGGTVTNVQFAGFIVSSILMALGTSVTRFVQNLLMSANRGIVPQASSFEKQTKVEEQEPVTYNAKHLARRAREVLTKKSSKSLRDVVYYQRGAMFKNLGTMMFLAFPWMANMAGKALGFDLGLDFSASYVPYTLYSLYTLRKVYKTRYKDAFPMNKTVLTNNLQDLQNSTAVKIAQVPPAELNATHPVLVGAAKQLKGAIDALVPVEAREQKTGINGLTLKHEAEVGEELGNLLLLAGRTPQEAKEARKNLQQAFDVLGRRDVKWYKVFIMKGLPTALMAMTFATFGELGFSNGLAFAARDMGLNGTAATGFVGLLLYGCMFGWRIIGNIISQRMSGGSMYALSSMASILGPALAALSVTTGSLGMLVAGTVTACFGISNFFSQMYEYMIGLYPKYKREIALLINFTMPLAALPVGVMKSKWFEGLGIPGLDMAICGIALAASVALTPGMLANSSIVRTVEAWWKNLKKHWKNPGNGTDALPPAPVPAQ